MPKKTSRFSVLHYKPYLLIKRKIIVSITVLISFTVANAQSSLPVEIKGTILDALTKEPLPSATVIAFEKATQKLAKVEISNAEGYFQLTQLKPNTYILRVQYIGYQDYVMDSLVLSSSLQLNPIYINPAQHTLSEVNVTGVKTTIEQKANTTTIHVAESALATGGSVYDMLQKTPGVSAKDDAIKLRGKPLSLLLDDRLVNLPIEEVINLLKSLPASSIEKIDLVNNPTGKYDGQVQALLNIKTFKPKNDSWGATLTGAAGAGQKTRGNGGINLFYKKNKLSTSLGCDYLNSSLYIPVNRSFSLISPLGYKNFYDERRTQDATILTQSLKLDIDYSIHPYHTIGFSLQPILGSKKILSKTTTFIQHESNNLIDSIYNLNIDSRSLNQNLAGNIYYKIFFDSLKNKELLINIDYYGYKQTIDVDYISTTLEPNFTEKRKPFLQFNSKPLDITIRSATADYTHNTSLGTWQAGLKTAWTTVDNRFIWKKYNEEEWITDQSLTDQFLYREYIQAAYGGFSGQFKKINIDLSLRAEHTFSEGSSIVLKETYPRTYANLFPSATITYHPSADHEWIIAYRRNIKRPLYKDINPFPNMISPSLYLQGNPSLFPELTHTEEITYSYRQKLFCKLLLKQYTNGLSTIMQELPITQQGLVEKNINFKNFYEQGASIYVTPSLTSWWDITISSEINFEYGNYPGVEIKSIIPKTSFSFSSNMRLPKNWNIESSGKAITAFADGFYYWGPRYFCSLGIKKSFLDNRLTTSLLLNGDFPYWYHEKALNLYSELMLSFDNRFFMLSITYNLGNKKNNSSNRKTGVESEKNRL